MPRTIVSAVIKVLAVALLAVAPGRPAAAHEIPTDVVIKSFVRPTGNSLEFLVRVPLEAMRDVNFPETRQGYLKISQADEAIRDAATVWIAREISIYENGRLLDDWTIDAARLALPSDRSFDSYDDAVAAVNRPRLADSENLVRNQALLDVLIRYPIDSATSEFSVRSNLARLGIRTTTVIHFLPGNGADRVYQYSGDPGLVRLDPRWYHAFFAFITYGISHILDGYDHLLFVICLLIPFRRIRPLIAIVTSFTVAHSITLFASALGMVPNVLWFPPLIETGIAASIVYMAFENIVGSKWEKRWMIAFGFGLVHGFGFSFALSEIMQFAGGHLLTSLLGFNLGVEIGQLMVICVAVPVLNFLFRNVVAERMGTILVSAVLAHSGWHWMADRFAAFTAYDISLPAFNLALLASLVRWAILFVIIGAVLWVLLHLYGRFLKDTGSTLSQSADSG